MYCIGHRGASGYEPENTLRSVQAALDLGVDAIEVDVRAVAGELLVIHDHRLERTTNGRGRLVDHPLAYLRSLDAGKGERIPTLQEVLDVIGKRAELIVEIKGKDTVEGVVRLIQRQPGAKDRFVISSFDHHQLAQALSLDSSIRRAPLFLGTPIDYASSARLLKPHSFHLSHESLRVEFIQHAKNQGCQVFVFTVNHSEDLEEVRALGADGVFTDYPDLVAGRKWMRGVGAAKRR